MRKQIENAGTHGLYMFFVGVTVFLFVGVFAVATAPRPLTDFRVMYYAARCLLADQDPYDQNHTVQIYRSQEASMSPDDAQMQEMVRLYVYPPTTFVVTAPFALLSWNVAKTLWLLLYAASAIFSSWLIWKEASPHAPIVSGVLISFLLYTSQVLWITGSISGLAVALCAIAVYCFLRERCLPAGILCMALTLLIKPQESGLVWLYFLLAGGVYRKRALQTLLAVLLLAAPMLIWVSHVAPNWVAELQTSLQTFFAPGGLNAPGLASNGGHGVAEIISLQAIFSIFRDDPSFYNRASFLTSIPLLVLIGGRFCASGPPRRTPGWLWQRFQPSPCCPPITGSTTPNSS